MRDKILGLFLIAGLALGGVLFYWVRGGNFGDRGFDFKVKFPQASGINVGATVRFRGVQVGRVKAINTTSNAIEVVVSIDNPSLAIPLKSSVETIQSSLLGSTDIEIFPQEDLPENPNLVPTSPECNKQLIVCQGETVIGSTGVSFTELLRESGQFFRKVNDEELFADLKSTLKNASIAAESISKLTLGFNKVLTSVEQQIARFGDTSSTISQAAENVSSAASSATALINDSREQIAQTLDSIARASKEAESLIASARPLLDDGKLIDDLRNLAVNASETATNLRQITGSFADPATLNTLRETIESARATFANAQKITTDLDELTGDPRLRRNLRNLIEGLSGLVSDAPSSPVAGTKENP